MYLSAINFNILGLEPGCNWNAGVMCKGFFLGVVETLEKCQVITLLSKKSKTFQILVERYPRNVI